MEVQGIGVIFGVGFIGFVVLGFDCSQCGMVEDVGWCGFYDLGINNVVISVNCIGNCDGIFDIVVFGIMWVFRSIVFNCSMIGCGQCDGWSIDQRNRYVSGSDYGEDFCFYCYLFEELNLIECGYKDRIFLDFVWES